MSYFRRVCLLKWSWVGHIDTQPSGGLSRAQIKPARKEINVGRRHSIGGTEKLDKIAQDGEK